MIIWNICLTFCSFNYFLVRSYSNRLASMMISTTESLSYMKSQSWLHNYTFSTYTKMKINRSLAAGSESERLYWTLSFLVCVARWTMLQLESWPIRSWSVHMLTEKDSTLCLMVKCTHVNIINNIRRFIFLIVAYIYFHYIINDLFNKVPIAWFLHGLNFI